MAKQSISNETKLEVLHDHYKETIANMQEFRHFREQLMLYLIVLSTVILFQNFSPQSASNIISQLLSQQLQLQTTIDVSFVSSVIWFGFLSLVIRYFQTIVYIERQYEYLHNLEDLLSVFYEGKAFTREGKFYLTNYPMFSNWTHIIYTWISPGILALIVITKISNEVYFSNQFTLLLIFNIIIALFILISITLYLLMIHGRK